MKENDFQKNLIKEIKKEYPGCYVLKNDARYIQGIPDLTILYGKKWATLEVKISESATHRPNQDERVNQMNEMSFSRFIFPGNKKEVLQDLREFLS